MHAAAPAVTAASERTMRVPSDLVGALPPSLVVAAASRSP